MLVLVVVSEDVLLFFESLEDSFDEDEESLLDESFLVLFLVVLEVVVDSSNASAESLLDTTLGVLSSLFDMLALPSFKLLLCLNLLSVITDSMAVSFKFFLCNMSSIGTIFRPIPNSPTVTIKPTKRNKKRLLQNPASSS